MAQWPPGEAEALFGELATMTPSRSSSDRLPRELSGRWEAKRDAWENALRAQETVPAVAVSVAFSVDGVTPHLAVGANVVAMKAKAAQRQVKQTEAGKHASGPAGHQAAGCATVSLYDGDGERLQTIRYARMPESTRTLAACCCSITSWILRMSAPDCAFPAPTPRQQQDQHIEIS